MWGRSTSPSAEQTVAPIATGASPRGFLAQGRIPRWASIGIAAAVLAAGAWGVVNSPAFRARSIEVTGASHVGRAAVLRLAGVTSRTNVLWLDSSAAARRLEANPWIASASVARSLPSTVRIAVTERTPAAELKVGSGWALVAGDGTVLGRVSRDPGLPSLQMALGERRFLTGPAAVVGGMSPWLRARVRSVIPDRRGSVAMELSSGQRVLFGPPSDIAVKDQALAGIVRWIAASGATVGYIDLRAPLAPAVGQGSAPTHPSPLPVCVTQCNNSTSPNT